ncbi:SURF1 family protein [Maricaulis parjimensis]|uniref:SURF1 family protein n=1 Tax=Maricaulis parjimensis TaxID=144023 RepID=UPI00193A06C0|nr:SURF1 family protein [Maricaulis parjimensis]
MLHFRPHPWLTVFSIPALALLLWLGHWQVERMGWKAERIAAYENRTTINGFGPAVCTLGEAGFSPRVEAPMPLTGDTLRYYTLRDRAGWVRLGAIRLPACGEGGETSYLLVETAFEPLQGEDRVAPRAWRLEPVPAAGIFSSRNDPDTNQWYRFDPAAMADALQIDPDQVLDVWAVADNGLPAVLAQTPPSRHFGYALTWYGLALALVGVYLALHIGQGRLKLGGSNRPE